MTNVTLPLTWLCSRIFRGSFVSDHPQRPSGRESPWALPHGSHQNVMLWSPPKGSITQLPSRELPPWLLPAREWHAGDTQQTHSRELCDSSSGHLWSGTPHRPAQMVFGTISRQGSPYFLSLPSRVSLLCDWSHLGVRLSPNLNDAPLTLTESSHQTSLLFTQ